MKATEQASCAPPPAFPRPTMNRPALPRIAYRLGDYDEIRASLRYYLDRAAELANWTHREPDDPGIALLEGAALLGDILTFYQQLYANETYLRTAVWRDSVAELVRLLGYRLSPGLGGKATFAFDVKGDEPVQVPAGVPLQVQLDGIDDPATFETDAAATAYAGLSRFPLYRPLTAQSLAGGVTELVVTDPDGASIELESGDRLMIGIEASGRLEETQIIVIDAMSEIHGKTIVQILGALQLSSEQSSLTAYKLGRSFRHFGHNAPEQLVTLDSSGNASASDVETTRYLSSDESSENVNPALKQEEFPLDSEVPDLACGGTAILQTAQFESNQTSAATTSFTHLRTIRAIKTVTMRWGALAGSSTLLTLDNDIGSGDYAYASLASIQIHEVLGPKLTVYARSAESTPSGMELYFGGSDDDAAALSGRRILWTPEGEDPVVAVAAVEPASGGAPEHEGLFKLTLDREVDYSDFPNEEPTLDVLGNLIDATQGKTEKEVLLGNGDASLSFQTFKLPKTPLTYRYLSESTPPETPELAIYVNDRAWTRVAYLFGQGPTDEVYIVREDDDENSYVQFGDGKTGARLPSGVGNVKARYRTGNAAFGALKPGTTVQVQQRIDNLNTVELPGVASGGAERESSEKSREAAPGKVQSLDRIVSVADVESEALAIAGVSRAAARWTLVEGIPSLAAIVLMDSGREDEFASVEQVLAQAARCRGPNRFPVVVRQGSFHYVYLEIQYALSPGRLAETVEPAIEAALGVVGPDGSGEGGGGLFDATLRRFGEAEYANRIAGTVQNVDGVAWAKVLSFGSLGSTEDPATLTFPAAPSRASRLVPPPDQVLRLYDGLDQGLFVLHTAPAESSGGCDE